MNGSYLITDLSQEAAIAKVMLKIIKDSLENQQFVRNRIKLGVSAMKPELFKSLSLIVRYIESSIKDIVIQRNHKYEVKTAEFIIEGGANPGQQVRVDRIIIKKNSGEHLQPPVPEVKKKVEEVKKEEKKISQPNNQQQKPSEVKPEKPSSVQQEIPPVNPIVRTQNYHVLLNYVTQGYWTIAVPPTIENEY